jgi:excisionase family DNA binding protein
MDVTAAIATVEQAIHQATPAECPALVGELARLAALAQLRLQQGAAPTGSRPAAVEDYLSMPEVAQRLHIPASRAYELARQGRLPVVRIGKYVRCPAAALAGWRGA